MITQLHSIHDKRHMSQPRAWACYAVVLLLLVLATTFCEAALEDVSAPEAKEVIAVPALKQIDELALKLGDESFVVREQAMVDLWKLGKDTLPALRRIEAGDDIEASERARELIFYVSAGLLHDSPEQAKELVLRFLKSNDDGKIIITHKLLQLRQWKQVMYLAKLENNAEIKGAMSRLCWPRVEPIIRKAMAEDNHQLVSEILELTGDSDLHMRFRAFYYTQTGQGDEELRKAAALKGERAARWRMWLHRAGGNFTAAIEESQQANNPVAGDLLRVLNGDAVPWLERSATEGDTIYQWGCKLQQLRLEGKEAEAEAQSRQWKLLGQDPKESARIVRCLAANGFREEALGLLQSSDANAAFHFYDLVEMPRQSLKLLGILENAKPPYTNWVNKRIEELKEDDRDTRDMAAERVMMLASFLYARGEKQYAREVLTPMMTLFVAQDGEDWNEHIEMMANEGLGSLSIYFIKREITEDGADHGEFAEAAKKLINLLKPQFRDCLWDHLKSRHLTNRNGEDVATTIDQIGLLAGLLPDPDDRTTKLHEALVAEAIKLDDLAKDLLITTLYQLCLARNDLTAASQMVDSFADQTKSLQGARNDLDYNLLRWESIEPVLAARVQARPEDRLSLGKWHIALLKLGQTQKAEEAYRRAMLLSLGDPESLIDWGHYLYAVGYEEKAIELWFLAAALSDLDGDDLAEYSWAVTLLASNGESLYASGDWQKALAISEVFARFVMRSSAAGLYLSLKVRYRAEFCHGMMMLHQGGQTEGLRRLDIARQLIPGDGALADDFFPALRNKIPVKTYQGWFDESYAHIEAVSKDYPQSHNSHNTAAWLAARAVRNLDEAYAHAQKAVSSMPNQGAYLDTMAEVWFARGDRQKALMWSKKAIAASISHAGGSPRALPMVYANYQQLSKQYEHFKNDPLPNKVR